MDIKRFRKKLERYVKGTANETESAIVEAWYKSYQAAEEREINAVDKAVIQDAIRHGINLATIPPVKIRRVNYYGIAASLLLISSVALFYYRSQITRNTGEVYTTLQTKAGEIKQITLPDSSVMWVKALSRVRIPSTFNSSMRNVMLDEGEAFFEVKHNASKPFKVHTPALQVQVLGTSFNINAYKNLKHTRVAVATGRVAVIEGGKTLTFIIPGRELSFNNSLKTYSDHKINIGESLSWKDGETYLKQASFNELAVVMKNLYGITLKPASPALSKYQFTLRLQHRMPVNEALKIISVLHNNHFRKEGNQVILY